MLHWFRRRVWQWRGLLCGRSRVSICVVTRDWRRRGLGLLWGGNCFTPLERRKTIYNMNNLFYWLNWNCENVFGLIYIFSWAKYSKFLKNDINLNGYWREYLLLLEKDLLLLLEEDHPLPWKNQLPSNEQDGLVIRLQSILISYENQIRHLTRSTPHGAQVFSANLGNEARVASPSTLHDLATAWQTKGKRALQRRKIRRPPKGHVEDRKA